MRLRRFFVVSRDRSILLSCVLLRGTYLWSFRALQGLRMSLCGLVKSVFWHRKLFLLALASAKRIGELHALSYRVSHTSNWGEVSFSFVTGFVAKTRDPSSLAPRFEGFSVPALPNARNNRNGRLLCPVRAVRVYLDRTAPHRPRCERFFVTAGRSKKEIAKTTVSFWLRKTISRTYQRINMMAQPPAPLTSLEVMQRMTVEPRCCGGGGVSPTNGLVIKSVTTSPHLGR